MILPILCFFICIIMLRRQVAEYLALFLAGAFCDVRILFFESRSPAGVSLNIHQPYYKLFAELSVSNTNFNGLVWVLGASYEACAGK